MNIIFGTNINENYRWGNGNGTFADYDYITAPNGTVIDCKQVIRYVNRACDQLQALTGGEISEFFASLPILYTFGIPTMATDGDFIFINPGFVLELVKMSGGTIGVAFVILHEVFHNLYMHMEREKAQPDHFTDHTRANNAQDYEINLAIENTYIDPTSGPTRENPNAPYKQVFDGITEKCQGLINPDYRDLIWEEIYDQLPEGGVGKQPSQSQRIEVSDDYKDGYRDGWEEAVRELRAQGLIESVVTTQGYLNYMMSLCEAKISDYDAGFAAGKQAALNAIAALRAGQTQNGTQGGSPSPQMEPIPGLTTITPTFPIDMNNVGTGESDPNVPIDLSNTNQQSQQSSDNQSSQNNQNTQNDQSSGNDSSQGQPSDSNPGGNNSSNGSQPGGSDSSSQGSNSNNSNSGQTASGKLTHGDLDAISNANQGNPSNPSKGVIKVGTANGPYSGDGDLSTGDHTVSQVEGQRLAKEAGWDESVLNDKKTSITADPRKVFDSLKSIMGNKNSNSKQMQKVLATIEGILTPVIDWKKELKKKMKGAFTQMTDAGYVKKGIVRGMYNRFQDKEGETARRFVFCVDTSGSVVGEGRYFEQIVTEISNIAKQVGARHYDLILFNTHVYKHIKYTARTFPTNFNIVEPDTGGTSYTDTFNYINKNFVDKNVSFQAVLIFTDMDVTGAKIPKLKFNKNKLIWLVLNDGDYELELPGKILTVSQNDFKKGLNNYMAKNESLLEPRALTIPRRSIGQTKLVENFFDDDETEIPDNVDDYQPTPEDIHRDMVNSILAGGMLEEYKKGINDWFRKYTDCGSNYTVDPKTLDITVHQSLRLFGNMVPEKDAINHWESSIVIDKVEGDCEIGYDTQCKELPYGLPKEVTRSFRCTRMPKLESLKYGPITVGNNYILDRCTANMGSLDGVATTIGSNFYDNSRKFTFADYLAAVKTTESLNPTQKKQLDKLVESRIELAKGVNHNINEAFQSSILRRLQKNPNNSGAFKAMRDDIKVVWSEIPDSIIRPTYGNTGAALDDRRADNGTAAYGISIWCDSNDNISIISTGNNKGEWGGGRSWLYVSPTVISTINDRITDVQAANGNYTNKYDWPTEEQQKELIDKLHSVGIRNHSKGNMIKCSPIRDKSSLTLNHFLLIPDLTKNTYHIKGTDDPIPVDPNDVEAAARAERIKNFTYTSQVARRNQMSQQRKDDNTGIYLPAGNDKNPSRLLRGAQKQARRDETYKKYLDEFVSDNVIAAAKQAKMTYASVKTYIKELISSIATAKADVRSAILDLADNEAISRDTIDNLYGAFVTIPIRRFETEIKKRLTSIEASEQGEDLDRFKRYTVPSRKFGEPGEKLPPVSGKLYTGTESDKIQKRERENIVTGNNYSSSDYFRYYYQVVDKFALLMGLIDKFNADIIDVAELDRIAEQEGKSTVR